MNANEILNRVMSGYTDEELRNVRKGMVKYYSTKIKNSKVNFHITAETDLYFETMSAMTQTINDELWERIA